MFDSYAARWVGKHSVERIQGQLPPVLCLQHSLDRPQRGAARTQGAGMGYASRCSDYPPSGNPATLARARRRSADTTRRSATASAVCRPCL